MPLTVQTLLYYENTEESLKGATLPSLPIDIVFFLFPLYQGTQLLAFLLKGSINSYRLEQ